MGRGVIGCDICQDVCPWNRKSPVTQLAAFQPRQLGSRGEFSERKDDESLFVPELETVASLTQEEFSTIFRGSAVKRAKWRGVVRNACVALGNCEVDRNSTAHKRVVGLLERLASGDDALIAEHARWAIARLNGRELNSPGSAD
jgi:epoxyqueuosine reductase